jgi:purine-binding chemotaxis protein CheW
MSGLITFRLGDREYATALDDVREVLRLEGLVDLPGMAPPLAGVLDLRGTALPVLDLRPAAGPSGDVLVLESASVRHVGAEAAAGTDAVAVSSEPAVVGVAVDQVRAVVTVEELPRATTTPDTGLLPSYVVDVLRGPGGVVFLVDLHRLVDAARDRQPQGQT